MTSPNSLCKVPECVSLTRCPLVPVGTQQEIAARNLQNMRNARLLQQQNQGMLQMAPVQSHTPMPAQSDMGMAYVGPAGTQASMYQGMNPGMSQMLQTQHHTNQAGMAQRAAGGAGYGPGMLMNPALSQQQMKASAPPMPKGQAQRMQSMMGGGGPGQTWPQQQNVVPTISGRTSNDMVAFNNAATYMQGSQPARIPKQHFNQGVVNQGVVDPRTINPAGMSATMLSHRNAQQRGMPGMPAYGPVSAQTMAGGGTGGGTYMTGGQSQAYQRTSNQDLAYGYGGQSGGGVSFSLSDTTELDSTDGWMEEFFPGQ